MCVCVCVCVCVSVCLCVCVYGKSQEPLVPANCASPTVASGDAARGLARSRSDTKRWVLSLGFKQLVGDVPVLRQHFHVIKEYYVNLQTLHLGACLRRHSLL